MKVLVKRLRPNAKLPTRATPHSSGLDLYARLVGNEVWVEPGHRTVVWTGIAIELPAPALLFGDDGPPIYGYEAQVRPRSGLTSRDGLVAAFGTIDNDYRGEIGVTLFNHSDKPICVEGGQRIAQLVIAPVVYPEVSEVSELSQTERGQAGFGSTGE